MEVFSFKGPRPGAALVVLGGVHGNEPCGPAAVTRIMDGIEAGRVTLQAGELVCVPRVNEKALALNVRFVDANLNRILGVYDRDTHEGALVPALRAVLDRADYLLDLHSYTAGGPPFVFASADASTMRFARAMPGQAVITGWQECYRRAFPPEIMAPGVGTTEYARNHGCRALTFECGGHGDPAAPGHGYDAILAAMRHVGLLPRHQETAMRTRPPVHIRMKDVFIKARPGDLSRAWKHLEPIEQGQPFARYDDDTLQTAAEDGVVILPCPKVDIGVEWGYLGVRAP